MSWSSLFLLFGKETFPYHHLWPTTTWLKESVWWPGMLLARGMFKEVFPKYDNLISTPPLRTWFMGKWWLKKLFNTSFLWRTCLRPYIVNYHIRLKWTTFFSEFATEVLLGLSFRVHLCFMRNHFLAIFSIPSIRFSEKASSGQIKKAPCNGSEKSLPG